ncbi:c-type cytochrome [Jiulongibacter sediminis]|uniref:Heme-binding protein n=1 Tax=Jiulongibacter sediminis TaxID=1605367 RepID=A0A0P7C4U0_9BACT|nr:c-type cytochrome [Jiulongibacter sediminis]KPM48281.1 heme-binding protein [Jiulongibacter sediminis]TBX24822.1 heme-binding protein [Jiulongibacter sediminis]
MKTFLKTSLILLAIGFLSLWGFRPENADTLNLKLQPGFKAEHIFSPSENDMGSWVAMCFDDKGRMITSDQYGGLFRLKIPAIGSSNLHPEIEEIKLPLGQSIGTAHGLLYAFNSLFVMVNNRSTKDLPQKSGLYRLTDTDGDDEFDKLELMKSLVGDGEHGPHSIVLSPDKKSLYVLAGNHTDFPEMDEHLLPKTWDYDNLFPSIPDPRGHANNRHAPGGWLAKVDPETNHWQLVSAGYRNAFDLAFNDAGDLFVYDADMEWDFGLPWYRPTRICHATAGSEFGWRTGNGKWSPDFEDSRPAVVNIGQGSPTNLIYLKNARFPAKYKQSLLAFDWSFGIMHAIHLKPEGATYTAEREEFLSGVPLPLTDGVIGPDGALYFMTGGRRLQSDLYRVYYEGPMGAEVEKTQITAESKLRQKLESEFLNQNEGNIDLAWQNLDHADRAIRYAARILLEHQNVEDWASKIASESSADKKISALLALTRSSSKSEFIFNELGKIPLSNLSEDQLLDLLRAYEVFLYRMEVPDDAAKGPLAKKLNTIYPNSSAAINRQLVNILVKLDDDQVVKKTITLMKTIKEDQQAGGQTATSSADLILRNPQYGLDIAKMLEKVPPMQQTYFAVALSKAKNGWNNQLRETYFKWFKEAFSYRGGNSYIGFIDRARKMALDNVPEKQREKYDELSGGGMLTSSGNDLKLEDYPEGPWRAWNMDEASKVATEELSQRNFKRGKAMYTATTCNRCHGMQGEGGNIGPDLTRVGTRFSKEAILEAIIDPSKTISDQYAATEFQLKNGETIIARIINETDKAYSVSQNPYTPDYLVEVKKADIESMEYSKVSVMLPGLINSLNEEELKDLLAYLVSGGNPESEVFK